MSLSNSFPARTLFAVMLLLNAITVQAQPELRAQIGTCAVIGNVLQRLECFDALASSLDPKVAGTAAPQVPSAVASQSAASDEPSSVKATEVKATEMNATEDASAVTPVSEPAGVAAPVISAAPDPGTVEAFGKPANSEAAVTLSEQGEAELIDTVASVSQIDSAKVRITLTSGQVWGQTVGKRFLLREGDSVRIRPSGWGKDFRLYIDGKKTYIQVARIR